MPMTAVLSRSMDLDNSFTIDAESLTMKVPRTYVSSDWAGDGGYWFV